MEFIYNFMKKKAPAFDNKWFLNHEKNQAIAARFFYHSSYITVFFLFSNKGQILISLFAAMSFYFSSDYFREFVSIFADLGIFYGIQYMVFNIPLFLIFLIVFIIFLMDLTLINTFLVCCPSVSGRIKFLYGENFLKQQYYNSALASAKAASQMSKSLAIGVAGGILGGTITNIYGEYLYSQNYKEYIQATINNPGLNLAPPKKGIFGFNLGR